MREKPVRTGDVFRDLGFSPEEAERLQSAFEPDNSPAEGHLDTRVDLFSVDTLINLLARLGIRVGLVVRPPRGAFESRNSN